MVRATTKAKKKTNTNDNSVVLNASKAFSGIDFRLKPAFKKKSSSSKKQRKTESLITNGLKTMNNLLKSKQKAQNTSIGAISVPFTKVYRNVAKKNYTNKSSHLINMRTLKSKSIGLNDEQNNDKKSTLKRNNKKGKRSQRRKELKQRIEATNNWTMNGSMNESMNGSMDDITNDDEKNKDLMSINALKDSLKDAEKEIVLERKQKSKRNHKRQIEDDGRNLSELFKSDLFDANPIKYTMNILKQEQESLNMKSEMELKEQKLLFSFKYKNGLNKGNKRKNKSLLSENELKKQITKQMSLMKQQSANKKKIKLNGKLKRKIKLKKNKNSKYSEKKIRRKMSNFAKQNQKKRRWRI